MNKTRILGLVAMAAIGAGAAYFVISEIRPRIMAACWRQQIDAAADEKVEDLIGRIGEKDGGVSILVEALGSERESVALAAKRELFVKLDQWHRLPAGECAQRITELARALAGRVEGFNPAGQRDAVDVAVRILDRPIKGRGINTQRYIAASEKILHVGLNAKGEYIRKKAAEVVQQARSAAGEDVEIAERSRSGSPGSDGQAGAGQAPKVEGGSAAKADEEEMQTADSAANRPWRLGEGRQGGERNRASRIADVAEEGLKGTAPFSLAGKLGELEMGERGTVPFSLARKLGQSPGVAAGRRLPGLLAGEDTMRLIKDLNSESDARAEAAEAELIGRGFKERQLELARKLFDPDPAVRKKLVQDLPGMEGVDAAAWLFELCRDAEAEVRLAAMTILATSSDPAVLDRVEEMAGRDVNDGVRRIGERVGQQRGIRR